MYLSSMASSECANVSITEVDCYRPKEDTGGVLRIPLRIPRLLLVVVFLTRRFSKKNEVDDSG